MQQQLTDITAKFFKYFDTRFQGVDRRFRRQDEHIDGLYRLLDTILKQIETKEHELLAGDVRVTRVERKVELLARQTRQRVIS